MGASLYGCGSHGRVRSECVWEVSTVRRKVGVTELTPAAYAGHSSLVWSVATVSNVDGDAMKYTVPRNNGRSLSSILRNAVICVLSVCLVARNN